MKLEMVAGLQGIVDSRDIWKVVWQVSLSVAALSFVTLGWLMGRGGLLQRNAVREPWLPGVSALLGVIGGVAFVLGLVAAVVYTSVA